MAAGSSLRSTGCGTSIPQSVQSWLQRSQHRDDHDDNHAESGLCERIALESTQRSVGEIDAGSGEARRQPESVHGGEKQHDQKQSNLGQQQAAVIGPDERRDAAGEHPSVDKARAH